MHNAPSVLYPVGRSRFLGWLVTLLWLAGALAAAGQGWHAGGLAWPVLLTGGSVLLAGALAWWSWQHTPHGALRWDGGDWHWLPETRNPGAFPEPLTAPPQIHLDLQQVLLLSLSQAGSRRVWLWLERAQSPMRWDDLRRAVLADRQRTPNLADAVWPEKGPV